MNKLKFAVLIDADNTSHNKLDAILQEIAKYGTLSVKRIYGDWSSGLLQVWSEKLLPHAITPVQQFAYTKGKDATDMRLIIDAMDLLYAGDLDGFCIVSSDSDFTPLASRIRESGLLVYGFGREQTSSSFVNACDKFIRLENLATESSFNTKNIDDELTENSNDELIKNIDYSTIDSNDELIKNIDYSAIRADIKKNESIIDKNTLNLIYKAIKDNADDSGWANLAIVGQYLNNVKPDFDTRTYGRAKLSGLIKLIPSLETKIENSQMYVRKFPFLLLIEYILKILDNGNKDNEWVAVNDIAEQIYNDKQKIFVVEPNFLEIVKKLLAVNSYKIEFSENSDKIRKSIEAIEK